MGRSLISAFGQGDALEGAFDALCRFAETGFAGGACVLHLVDDEGRLRLAAGHASARLAFLEAVQIGPDAPPCGRAAWSGAHVEFGELAKSAAGGWRAEAANAGVRGWLAAPILSSSGETAGVLSLLFRKRRSASPAERAVLEGAAAMAWLLIERRQAAQKLRESEQRLLDFAESTSDWLWETDREHRFTWYRPQRDADGAARAIPGGAMGRSRREIAQASPDDPHWAAHLADLAAHRSFRDFIYRVDDGGRRLWLRASGRPVFAPDGGFLGYRGCTADITKAIEAEGAAAASEAEARRAHRLLRDAVESLQDGFAVFDSEERLVLANDSFWSHPSARPDWPAATFAEMLDSAAADVLMQPAHADAAAWKAWRLDRFRNPAEPFEVRFRDGRCARVSESRTREGGVVHVRTDVTHDKRRKAKLLASGRAERRQAHILRSVIEGMGAAVFVCDPTGAFILTNPAATALAGEATERPYPHVLQAYEVHTPDGGRRLEPAELPMARALAGEATDDFEMLLRAPGRGDLTVSATGRPIRDGDGASLGAVVVVRDVTQHRRTQSKLAHALKLEAVGQLTGGIAHDFNNLLTVILSHADLLVDALGPDEGRRRMATQVRNSALRAAELTRTLLAFSRRQPLEPGLIEVNGMVRELVELLGRTLGEDVELAARLGAGPAFVNADRGQLETALLNLAVNARDAMPHGGELTISVDEAELAAKTAAAFGVPPGRYLRIAVSDAGCGMAPEVVARAFEPFFTTKEVGKGSGLGLSLVYGFIKQSGGHVQIVSAPGQGATVSVYLPRVEAQAEACVRPAPAAPQPRGDGEAILVVEDDPAVRKLAADQLGSLGYRVATAENGAEALARLGGPERFDLLFTDLVMPGRVDGREVATQARRLRPDIAVLLTSGYGQDILERRSDETPSRMLRKPYRREDLARMVRDALDRSTRSP